MGGYAQVFYVAASTTSRDKLPDKILGDIPNYNQRYIERPAIDESLHKYFLKSGPIIAVNIAGLSGMGKTEYCVHYAYHANQYDCVIFLPGETSCFQASFNKIINPSSTLLTLDSEECNKYYTSLEEAGHKKVLIVIDNVESFGDIKMFLPLNFAGRSCQFHLIITSQKAYSEMNVIPIGGFTPHEIRQIANRMEEKASYNDVTRLCEILHNYPLAIITAINTVEGTTLSIDEFLEAFQTYEHVFYNGEILADLCPTYPCPHYPTYIKSTLNLLDRTFGVLFNYIKTQLPEAFDLLGYLCVLNNAPIPKDFLFKLMPGANVQEALDLLLNCALIDYQRKVGMLTIHQLASLCYKQLHLPLYLNKSYEVQLAINQELIAVVDTNTSCDLTRDCLKISPLIDHALLVRSKVVRSVDTAQEANMLCNTFYLVALYHIFNHNPEGVALAILHFDGALESGEDFCYFGQLFNRLDYPTARFTLKSKLERMKNDKGYDNAMAIVSGRRNGKYYFAEEMSLLCTVDTALSNEVVPMVDSSYRL